jgi:4-alpha-glucanotransferase
MRCRGSGILLHITSLPSPFGIGDLGPGAYKFIDFLVETKQCYWQILPLNPTSSVLGNSPYNSPSAFAGNPLLISPELLIDRGFISDSDLNPKYSFNDERVDYENVSNYKEGILRIAFEKNKNGLSTDSRFQRFCNVNSYWLEDYALFVSLKESFNNVVWTEWPEEIRDRTEGSLRDHKERLENRISMAKFYQYLFFDQWSSLKEYCNARKISIIGDVPIYVTFDSSDVWTNPEVFKLDEQRRPRFVAGVPPDYFSETGQLWGNPVYNWEYLRQTRYSWWIKRLQHNLTLTDIIRLDHFRGLVSYWEVSAGEETAVNGRWVDVPAGDFFKALLKRFPNLPVIAEDLGIITPDVREVMNCFGFPGMKLLIFAFGDDFPNGAYLPHNYSRNCVVYTGTHDNNTVKGWFRSEASPPDKKRLFSYIGRELEEENINWELIRLLMGSVANTVIIPMQDILGLGEESKMNLPATSNGNWQWRLNPKRITPLVCEKLGEITETYARD